MSRHSNFGLIRHGLVALAVAGGVCLGGAAFAAGAQVTFRYNPPDKTTYTETTATSSAVDLGKGKKQSQKTSMVHRRAVTKTAKGFRVVSTLTGSSGAVNGKPIVDPISKVITGVPITYELDSSGKLTGASGFDEVVKRVKAAMGSKLTKDQAKTITAEGFQRAAMSEWAARYAPLLGKTVKLDERKIAVEPYPVAPGKNAPVYTVLRFINRPNFQGHNCVEIRSDFNTDARALAKATGADAAAVLKAKPPQKITLDPKTGAKVSGYAQRIVDPATLLSYGETTVRTVALPATDKTKSGVTQTSKTTSTFAYGK